MSIRTTKAGIKRRDGRDGRRTRVREKVKIP